MNALVVTGASSFIGRALLGAVPAGAFPELRILAHRRQPEGLAAASRLITIAGDLLDPDSLRELVVPGATVVHLAHLASPHTADDHLAGVRNLIAACRNAGIRRLVHCSTAVVAGSVPDDVITEETTCRPYTEYERVKYRLEQELREAAAGAHRLAILRPTQVFGPGGRNLLSLAGRILSGSAAVNSVYSSFQGRRRMNLVSVYNAAAALGFLATADGGTDQQAYLISDDDDPSNNFRDVERILARELGRQHPAPLLTLPSRLLSAALSIRGRSNTNPDRIYSDAKLKGAGFVKPWSFEAALADFARWFRAHHSLAP